MIETVLISMFLGLGLGALAAVAAKVSSEEPFEIRKFASAIIIGAISGLTVVQGIEGGIIDETNLMSVVLAIFGASFVGSKTINMLSKIKK